MVTETLGYNISAVSFLYTLYNPLLEYAAQEDIYSFGPISAVMDVYDDIYSYNGTGVYENVTRQFVGLHSVRVIG